MRCGAGVAGVAQINALAGVEMGNGSEERQRILWMVVVLIFSVFLSLFTVFIHVKLLGLSFYEDQEMGRMTSMVQGTSGTPWQYRQVMAHVVLWLVGVSQKVGVPRPVGTTFVAVRLLQNFLVFALAVLYYRKLGLSTYTALIGISLAAWGMVHSHYDNGMSFDTYTDIIFFLIAALLILRGSYAWLIPLMPIAALNRETSGCIPLMLLASQLELRPRPRVSRSVIGYFLVTMGIYAVVIVGLRLHYGLRPYIVPTCGKSPFWPLLIFNLTWYRTWVFMFATLGLLPLMAAISYRAFPRPLKAFLWAIVPLWIVIMFPFAQVAETRLFLVPQILVFVPGALFGISYWAQKEREQLTG